MCEGYADRWMEEIWLDLTWKLENVLKLDFSRYQPPPEDNPSLALLCPLSKLLSRKRGFIKESAESGRDVVLPPVRVSEVVCFLVSW